MMRKCFPVEESQLENLIAKLTTKNMFTNHARYSIIEEKYLLRINGGYLIWLNIVHYIEDSTILRSTKSIYILNPYIYIYIYTDEPGYSGP